MYQSFSLHGLDLKLLKYLNFKDGFFIEAGANDGISQSNTLMYELNLNWKGLLIEPNEKKFNQCKENRKNSIVENAALVSKSFKNEFISGNFDQNDYESSLMAMVTDNGDYNDEEIIKNRNERIEKFKVVKVPALTLSELLDIHKINKIDFFSLDVEGYEISVLNGIDFQKHRPTYILIETANRKNYQEEIKKYMENKKYKMIEKMSINDDLFIDIQNEK